VSLALKYRPDSFDNFLGNAAVKKSLLSVLRKRDVPAVFLFTGISGVGKTTLARIVARKLGGGDVGIIEINAADLRGIDSVRDLISKANVRLPGVAAVVYILDEAHQFTRDAQNALLKVLEDTPKGTFFILCTTNPSGILATIRTRCSEYGLLPLNDEDSACLLSDVSNREGMVIDVAVGNFIIEQSAGSARLLLKLLEKVGFVEDRDLAIKIIENSSFLFEGDSELARGILREIDLADNVVSAWHGVRGVIGKRAIDYVAVRNSLLYYFEGKMLDGYNERAVYALEILNRAVDTRAGFLVAVFDLCNLFLTVDLGRWRSGIRGVQ